MQRIPGYIIILFALIVALPMQAQVNAGQGGQSAADTLMQPGLRIGVNIVRPLMVFPAPSRFGIEAVADYNFSQNYFAVAEGGVSRRSLDEPGYNLIERGVFFRIGADRPLYTYYNDVIAIGGRLGFSTFNRKAPHIIGYDPYWGSFTGSLPVETFFSHWAEVVLALKTEVFTNFFLGWNIRGKMLLAGRNDRHLEERYIPGFGEGNTNTIAGFDFYIYYRIPL
jgi:hypothetical protein